MTNRIKPKYRNQRLLIAGICALAVIAGTFLVVTALQKNKQFFRHPSDVVSPLFVQSARPVKIGGLVTAGSVDKQSGLVTLFEMIDFDDPDPNIRALRVRYEGVLPDLFREGQGVVVSGKLSSDGMFMADEVLAKHDENYMPKMPEKMNLDDKS